MRFRVRVAYDLERVSLFLFLLLFLCERGVLRGVFVGRTQGIVLGIGDWVRVKVRVVIASKTHVTQFRVHGSYFFGMGLAQL